MYFPIDLLLCKTIVFLFLILIFTTTDSKDDCQEKETFFQVPLVGEQEQPQKQVITLFAHFCLLYCSNRK